MAWILYFSSLLGYGLAMKARGLVVWLIPIQLMTAQALWSYAFSFTPFMAYSPYLLVLGGWVCLLLERRQISQWTWSKLLLSISFPAILAVFLLVVVFIGLGPLHLIHDDNFTHWATMAKFLYLEQRLPGLGDRLISYNNYPPATALHLFNVSKLVGFSDANLLRGQWLLIWASLISFFALIRNSRRIQPVALMAAGISFLFIVNHSLRVNSLLVDFLLPLVALAALVGVKIYAGQPKAKASYLIPLLAFLGLVKSSAAFFLVIVLVWDLLSLFRGKGQEKGSRKSALLWSGLSLLMVVVALFSWQVHVDRTFGDQEIDKHQVTQEELVDIIEVGLGQDTSLPDLFLDRLASLDSWELATFYGASVVFVLFSIAYGLIYHDWLGNFSLLVIGWFIFALYQIGLLVTYLTAMPLEEAKVLAGFDRYQLTISVFLISLYIWKVVDKVQAGYYEPATSTQAYKAFANLTTKKAYQWTSLLCLMFYIGSLLSEVNGLAFSEKQAAPILAQQMEAFKGQDDYQDAKILVVSAQEDQVNRYYTTYVGRYVFWNPNLDARYDFMMDLADFQDLLKSYDYVLLLDDHYTFRELTYQSRGFRPRPGIYPSKDFIFQ